jgi:hypothetical protein
MQHIGFRSRALALALSLFAIPAFAATEPAAAKPDPAYEYFATKVMEYGYAKLGLLAVGSIFAGLVVTLLVCRVVAGPRGTFRNSLRYYIISVLLTLAICGVAVGLGWFCVMSGAAGGALIIAFFGLAAMVLVAFVVPITVFDIGIFRALLLNVLIAVATGGVQTAVMSVVPGPFDHLAGKSQAETRQIIAEWDMERKQKAMEERMKELAGYEPAPAPVVESVAAQAQRLYTELQQVRAALDVNDQAAVERFNQRVAEYNAVKARLAPAAASPGATTAAAGR